MAIELITGRAGAPHVDSADVGAFNAAMFGGGVYVVEGCEATLTDANHVLVSAGELLCEGRHVRVTGSGETLAIDNGLSGYNRNDIIAMRYERNSNDIETCSLVVIKGNQDTRAAQDPPMPSSGKLLDGASNVYWPLYRISVEGLTPQAPVNLAGGNPIITTGDGALPIANGGTGANTVVNALANLGIADKVTAKGTSGGWSYMKYDSGVCVMWTRVANADATTSGKCRYKVISYPFTLTDVDSALTTTFSNRPAYELGFLGASVRGVTTSSCEVVFDWTDASDRMSGDVLIVGKWK